MASPSFWLPSVFAGEHPFLKTFPHHLLVDSARVSQEVAELSRPHLSPKEQAVLAIALETAGRPRPGVTTEPSCFLGRRFP